MPDEQIPSVDEFLDALSDEPACRHRCRPTSSSDRCPNRSYWMPPDFTRKREGVWCCSLPKGHEGRHVACLYHGDFPRYENGHAVLTWAQGEGTEDEKKYEQGRP